MQQMEDALDVSLCGHFLILLDKMCFAAFSVVTVEYMKPPFYCSPNIQNMHHVSCQLSHKDMLQLYFRNDSGTCVLRMFVKKVSKYHLLIKNTSLKWVLEQAIYSFIKKFYILMVHII
jgi:hypothetical protein